MRTLILLCFIMSISSASASIIDPVQWLAEKGNVPAEYCWGQFQVDGEVFAVDCSMPVDDGDREIDYMCFAYFKKLENGSFEFIIPDFDTDINEEGFYCKHDS